MFEDAERWVRCAEAVDGAVSPYAERTGRAAMTAERIARDEAAGLRTRLDQLQARGLWARLRNKR